jgi:hypothetical protein
VTRPALPLSGRFALWFTAWASGRASLDDARDAIVAGDAAHDVLALPGVTGSQSLILSLPTLRGTGATEAGIALPVPGDLTGLAGPAPFNADVLEAGEGVVLDRVDLGLVPHRAGAGVQWTCQRAVSHRQMPDVAEADRMLRQAMLDATAALVDLDVARWRPEAADELVALRRPADWSIGALPPGTPPLVVRLASLAVRCGRIVKLALEDEGGSLTVAEAARRRDALAPLEQAARRALVAACSPAAWPPA